MPRINATDLPAVMLLVAQKIKAGVNLMKGEMVCEVPDGVQFSGEILIDGGLNAVDRTQVRTSDPNVAVTVQGVGVSTAVASAATTTTDSAGGEISADLDAEHSGNVTAEVGGEINNGFDVGHSNEVGAEQSAEDGGSEGQQFSTRGDGGYDYSFEQEEQTP